MSYYAALVQLRSEKLKRISDYLVADAYFSRTPFVSAVLAIDMHLISRFRDDQFLQYPYVGVHPKRRGPKTKYAARVDLRKLYLSYFSCCIEEDDFRVYEATVSCKALKQMVRVAIEHTYDKQG